MSMVGAYLAAAVAAGVVFFVTKDDAKFPVAYVLGAGLMYVSGMLVGMNL